MPRRSLALLGALLGVAGLVGFARAQAPNQTAPQRQPAQLRVLLPAANAQLMIDDTRTRQVGANRLFITPPLPADRVFSYTLTATWQPNNYTTIRRVREVSFRAGQQVEADLRKTDEGHPDKILVRYVPTPMEVVEAMLKLGEVAKDDIVYDLGCGDGRLVVTAVEKFGAKRGVGVDIDPERISDSKANAKKHGVEDKVDFRKEDVLELKDLGDANVVMLYMGQELNLRLRPILQKTLKPGSRVVSHRFTMGDWKPLKTETIVDKNGEKYLLHLWKIEGNDGENK